MANKISRRNFLHSAGLAAGAAAAAAALTGCTGSSTAASSAAASSEASAASASASTATVGTRYTKASNPDEIGIVHEASSEETADVVVVGSGISGVTCAMVAAEQDPNAKIIIVEARSICGGGTNFAEQPDMPAEGCDWTTAMQYGDEVSAKTNFVKDARLEAERKYDMGRNSAWVFRKHGIPLTIKNFERLKGLLDGFEAGTPITRWNGTAGYEGGNGSKTIQRMVDEINAGGTYANIEIRLKTRGIALSSMQAYVDGMHYQSWLCLAAGQVNTAVYVNQEGTRFVNEDMNRITEGATHPGVNRSKVVEGQGAVYSIIGSNLMNFYKENGVDGESFYGDGQAERPFDLDADLEQYADNPNIFSADTLEELAEKIGVPADALVNTITTYDSDAAAGVDTAFNKDAKYMVPVGGAPYYAFKLSSIVVNTNGGIRVDHDCRVVDQNFVPVEGLYATGLTISGYVTDVYETGNCQCVSIWSGLKAGRCLVEQCLGGTVADDWFGESEWDASRDLPNFANWDDYQAYLASL